MNGRKHGNVRQARILVVDADHILALTIQTILEAQGYKVETAFSGEEALAKAPGFAPDLLISEVCLGAMNGVEAATRITAKVRGCSVFFLSGPASLAEVSKTAPARLVYSFTTKPLHSLDLLNAIAYMLPVASLVDDEAVAIEHQTNPRDYVGLMLAGAGLQLQLQ